VFPDPQTGGMRPKHNGGVPGRNLWGLDVAIADAKVRRFRYPFHCFRHSHGTMLALAGANLTAIQSALGQSSLEMASRYTHAAAELARVHVAKLPALGPTTPTAVTSLDDARKLRGATRTNAYGEKATRTKNP
jgi:integrase